MQAHTVGELIDHLEREWPGLRNRLCEPGPTLRGHIHVYVNQERAKPDTPVAEQSRVDVTRQLAVAPVPDTYRLEVKACSRDSILGNG